MPRLTCLLSLLLAGGVWQAVPAAETVLYERRSPYSLVTVTEDERGLRTLMFDRNGVRQSVVKPGDPDHIELPYAKAALAALAFVERPERILVIGLGGGTIPSFLHKHYPSATIDAVDIDPDVVRVAREFFGFREDARMHAHVEDGRRFVEKCRQPYDLIFLDAFGAEEIPYHLVTRQFLTAVRRVVSPGGVVVANIWDRSANPLYDSMVRTYQAVFDDLYVLSVPAVGNRILFALPTRRHVAIEELARRARAISTRRRFRFDLGEFIRDGLRRESVPDPRGSVLLDRPAPTTASASPG